MSRIRIWALENNPQKKQDINICPVLKTSGHYTLDLMDCDENVIEHLEFDNVLTNQFLDGVMTGTRSWTIAMHYLALGTGGVTGVNAPSGSNTSLVNPFSARINRRPFSDNVFFVSQSDSGPYWALERWTEVDYLECNGNLSELGFYDITNSALMNRAAIKDVDGVPITLTKTSNNILRVKYEWRLYPPTNDFSGSFNILGTDYLWTTRITGLDNYNGWGRFTEELGVWDGWFSVNESSSLQPSHSLITATTGGDNWIGYTNGRTFGELNYMAYTPSTYEKTALMRLYKTGLNRFPSGIGNLVWSPQQSFLYGMWQTVFAPRIPKDSTCEMDIAFSWRIERK